MTNVHTNSTSTVLVIGSNGKTGRRVAQRLKDKNVPVRLGSRSSSPAFDWEDRSTWQDAVKGVSAVYLTYFPDLAVAQAPADISDFCEIAEKSGVKHIVLLSGRGEPEAQRCEDIVKDSGMDWTIIRASWFNQNFSEGAFLPMIMSGTIALPVGDVKEPFVDVNDIAEIATASLTQPGHLGKLYEVTGNRLLSFKDIAEEISRASGREIQFVQITAEQFEHGLREQDVPEPAIAMLQYLFGEVLDGRNAHLTDGVKQALGRAPRDFFQYAKTASTTKIWNI